MDNRLKFSGVEINPTSDELNLMPDSNREALFSIAKSLGENSDFIISGINAVINAGVDASVSAGYVLINQEIIKVDAQTVVNTAGTDIYVFQKIVTSGTSPDWDRTFRDGSTNNVFEKTRASVVNVAAAGSDLPINGNVLKDVLTPTLNVVDGSNKGVVTPAQYNAWNVAEQNVQSDWNSTSGDSFIQNKPEVLERIGTVIVPNIFGTVQGLLSPGNTVTPLFCSVVAICKLATSGYVIGDRAQATLGAHVFEGSVEHGATITNMTTSQTTFRMPSSGTTVASAINNLAITAFPANWDLEVTVWGYRF